MTSPSADHPKLLTLDGTYSLATILERQLEHEIRCRDLRGFFEHVWSVHPAVGASPEHGEEHAFGAPSWATIADRHTMIEGKVGQFRGLRSIPPLNFAIAQAVLLWTLSRLIRREGISIVRAGDPYYLGVLGFILARLHGIPLVVRVNANYDTLFLSTNALAYPRLLRWRWLEQRVAHFILSRAELVAPGSEDNLRFALVNGAHSSRSTLFRYGTWIDPIHFDVEPERRSPVQDESCLDGRPFAILVSRLEPVKHPEDVIVALSRWKSTHPELGLVLVGDGTMQGELEMLAARLGVSTDVVFAGNRDQPWIARALTSAAVILSPLTGRALVEACLSGTPVVAYDVEWHSEMIQTEETGLLVPYRDTEALARAVCRLLEEPEAASAMGKRAREKALDMMDPVRLMEHERSEYKKILARRLRNQQQQGESSRFRHS